MNAPAPTELLPCPFCGGRPHVHGPDNPGHEYWISCQSCQASSVMRSNHHAARAAWNARQAASVERAEVAGEACCKGLAPATECRCEIERKAAGHPPYPRSEGVRASEVRSGTVEARPDIHDLVRRLRQLRKDDLAYELCHDDAVDAVKVALGAAQASLTWHRLKDELPPIGKKIIALYNDGSGSGMFWRHDDGYIDCEGDEYAVLSAIFDMWAELPQDLEFWCETRSEDPMCLSLPSADGGPAA